jgi:hypothetical protein
MRIAQIAPLHEAVPPKLYGGTERVVSYLHHQACVARSRRESRDPVAGSAATPRANKPR